MRSSFLNYILPFKFCLFLFKIHGDLPPFSNGYVCESHIDHRISGRNLGKLAERSMDEREWDIGKFGIKTCLSLNNIHSV